MKSARIPIGLAAITAIAAITAVSLVVPPLAAQPACAAPTDERPAPPADAPEWPGWLLREQRYPELVRWVADESRHPAVSPADRAFFRGILANRENQNTVSIQLLKPLAARLDPVKDSAHVSMTLKTLADDYTKLYRYREAADVLARLAQHDAAMSAGDRQDLDEDIAIRRLLSDAPPQRDRKSVV